MTGSSAVTSVPEHAYSAAATRIMARCDQLARISATGQSELTRVYLSPEHAAANALTATWMTEAGMSASQDAAGNLVGVLHAADPDAASLMLGSHLDTVINAGRFDGILGVLMAIELVRLLAVRDETGALRSPFPFALEVAAFSDEEGTRFGKALLGSSAVSGLWDDAWLDLTDESGVTLRQAALDFGLDPQQIGSAARSPERLVGYLEAHIEQGPLLDSAAEPLAVVTSIASARRFQITVEGESRHAGGTPYDRRRDALLGASEAALAVERICSGQHHIIGTVGQFEAFPGAVNVVPGETRFSLDLRGELDGTRDHAFDLIAAEFDGIMGRRGLRWSAREVHNAPALRCAPLLRDVVREGIVATGLTAPAELFSPAGHDGMSLGAITDVGMLFLRNPDGISHHPDEDVARADVATGLKALCEAVVLLGSESRGTKGSS